MCQAIGVGICSVIYWDESKPSFDSFISLYDEGTSWDFLILFFRSQVGNADIDAQYLQGQRLGTSGSMAPSSVHPFMHHRGFSSSALVLAHILFGCEEQCEHDQIGTLA